MRPKHKGASQSTQYSHVAKERLARPRRSAREAPSTLVSMRPSIPSIPTPTPEKEAFAGRYELEDRIGRGGMSEVWAAFDRVRRERVALKIISLDCEDPVRAKARFEREAMLSRQLRGRPFVEVFDHGITGTSAFIAMGLLEGETLHDRLRRRKRLDPEECRGLLAGVAEGLRLAHALQIVHRDLKPGNIFFERHKPKASGTRSIRDLDETVKLLDFGIAKDGWDRANLTRPGMVLGSASYMSPEHIDCGPDLDARADLWSLAVVLYRALTGELPFPGRLAAAIIAIRGTDPRPPTAVNASLPASADAFFEQALAKDRTRRFQTIDDMTRSFAAAFPLPDDTAAERTRSPSAHGAWEFDPIEIGSFEGSEAGTLEAPAAEVEAPAAPPPPRWRASVPSVESVTMEQATRPHQPTARGAMGSLPAFRRSGTAHASPAPSPSPSRLRPMTVLLLLSPLVVALLLVAWMLFGDRIVTSLSRSP